MEEKRVSRAEICRTFGFSKSTVSEIVRDLLEDGLIVESGCEGTRLGRKPTILSVNGNSPKVVSLLVKDSGEMEAALLSLDGIVVRRERGILPRGISSVEAARRMTLVLRSVMSLFPKAVLGIGIGVPGIVEHDTGVIEYSANFNWLNFPLKELIEKEFYSPVFIENRTNAAALGEMWFGKALGNQSFICIHCGDALGASIVFQERIYRGVIGGVGEVGHIPISRGYSRLCSCGKRGCAETVVALPFLVEQLGETYRGEKEAVGLLSRLRHDPMVQALLLEAFRAVGEVTAVLVNILAPEKVIFVGALSRIDLVLFLGIVRETVEEKALYPIVQKVVLETSPFEEEREILWGAAVVVERLFEVSISY